jgi:Mg2+ and Co2+ transporter CorA
MMLRHEGEGGSRSGPHGRAKAGDGGMRVFLYDADGQDKELPVPERAPELEERQLLWVDVVGRDEKVLARLGGLLHLDRQSLGDLAGHGECPLLNRHGEYFHSALWAIADREPAVERHAPPPDLKTVRLDLLIGRNWLVTVADEEIAFLDQFREEDRGETLLGALSSASLAAALLDAHLTRFLSGLEEVENFVDSLDMQILEASPRDARLLAEVLRGRRFIATLRRELAPQRSVFYGLSRPDFSLVVDAKASAHFAALERRFERTVDTIEHARELVQGSFELFTTRLAETTNTLIRRLTFLSLALGAVGAVAGIFGMNFQTPYTNSGLVGFWMVIGALGIAVAAAAIVARWRKWI